VDQPRLRRARGGGATLRKFTDCRTTPGWQRRRSEEIGLPFEFFSQFPPELFRVSRPKQNIKTALFGFGTGSPFILHPAEPAEPVEEFTAKGCLEPGKIFTLGRPVTGLANLLSTKFAEGLPLALSLTKLDTTTDEIAALGGQRQVRAGVQSRYFAKRAVSLADHRVTKRA